ncbi:MAG: D-alanyl-D-alanine carboxypeptidase family protein [Variibacter sp.]
MPSRSASLTFRASVLVLAMGVATVLGAYRAKAESLLLVEADTGKVLHAENATYPWHPASISKLMTLYVTLRAVKEGRIGLDSLVSVSENAVAQAPSKMGFPVGTQMTVDNAIKMMMVKSANDIAVVLAEGVDGSIEKFADDMNKASARLGMTQSSWVNPNGLPADQQITSARDMAILARALIREFPEYDLYWHIPAIKFGRRIFRNYNKLIGHYPGADGMKTGFICASGYNLVSTATRNGKRLIAIVLGAPSGTARTETAARLLENGFESGATSALSWLMPSLGTVDALTPIAAAPPDLRDQICGKGRRHRGEEDEETTASTGGSGEASAAYASLIPNFRNGVKTGTLLQDLPPSMPPIAVSVIPVKGIKTDPDGAPIVAEKKKKGRKTLIVRTHHKKEEAAKKTDTTASTKTAAAPAASADKKSKKAKASAKAAAPAAAAEKPKPPARKKKPTAANASTKPQS